MSAVAVTVRALTLEDFEVWSALYAAYADFYQVIQTPAMRATVWAWLHDPQHTVKGLLAEDVTGQAVGFMHYRPYARPLAAVMGGFLDDLFVAPDARGHGVARQLFAALAAIGQAQGWSLIRWRTAESNATARVLYDKIAQKTPWLTYEMTCE